MLNSNEPINSHYVYAQVASCCNMLKSESKTVSFAFFPLHCFSQTFLSLSRGLLLAINFTLTRHLSQPISSNFLGLPCNLQHGLWNRIPLPVHNLPWNRCSVRWSYRTFDKSFEHVCCPGILYLHLTFRISIFIWLELVNRVAYNQSAHAFPVGW